MTSYPRNDIHVTIKELMMNVHTTNEILKQIGEIPESILKIVGSPSPFTLAANEISEIPSEFSNPSSLFEEFLIDQKIRSIKQLRTISSLGLKDAKDIVEWCAAAAERFKNGLYCDPMYSTNDVFRAFMVKAIRNQLLARYGIFQELSFLKEGIAYVEKNRPVVYKELITLYPDLVPSSEVKKNNNHLNELSTSIRFAIMNAKKLGHDNAFDSAQQVLSNWQNKKSLFKCN